MIDTIYIEEAVLHHARTKSILARFDSAQHIVIERYAEAFNSHTQNFRLQKQNPSLILAQKNNKRVLSTPAQYETGGGANYYFSHMLNCLYDCRYCFLQGMYRSANYLLFVNYQDFITDIKTIAEQHASESHPPWFFSGYDCDSLAMEPVTGFADQFLEAFRDIPEAVLELRTKSTQIRSLLKRKALSNVVVAFSLSPEDVANAVEIGAPSVAKRIEALKKLQAAGWRIGVRFDPVVWHDNYQSSYKKLIQQVFDALKPEAIDSVTLGGFRLPKGYYKTMRQLFPEHWLFSAGLEDNNGMIAYQQKIEIEMFDFIKRELSSHISAEQLYSYPTNDLSIINS